MSDAGKPLAEIAEGYVKLIREAPSHEAAMMLMREFGEKAHRRGWLSAMEKIIDVASRS